MNWRIRVSLVLSMLGYALTLWCLVATTAISMTLFFSLALPLFGLSALLYIIDVLLDLRQHEVL